MMIFRQCQNSLAFAASKRGECRISGKLQLFSICVSVTVQIGVLHNPNVTFSKFSGSTGYPLTALEPATFLRAAQIPS
jgi:hypothetical protein